MFVSVSIDVEKTSKKRSLQRSEFGSTTRTGFLSGFTRTWCGTSRVKAFSNAARVPKGIESVEIIRDVYAIEYDCIDATQSDVTLMAKHIERIFFSVKSTTQASTKKRRKALL